MEKVKSYSDFIQKSNGKGKSFLLLYKPESGLCSCAYQNLEAAVKNKSAWPVFAANVSEVQDIHTRFDITTVPSFLIFENGKYKNSIKGCQESDYYDALMENSIFQNKMNMAGKEAKRVTVYSTPTCSWCNTLKDWLQKNSIQYTDIDISRDLKAATELVRRSGQQGVPQTDINGQIVVGFNQPKLKELLEIQ